MRYLITALLLTTSCFGGTLTNTTVEVQNAMRLILSPAHLAAQLEETNAPIATACAQGIATNILGVASLTLTDSQDFTFDEVATNFYYDVSGATATIFNLIATMSFKYDQPNTAVTIRATKNGSAIDGIYAGVTTSAAAKNNEVTLSGHFSLADADFIELSVEADTAGVFSATSFATSIKEEAQ